jgi:hypothetical protein
LIFILGSFQSNANQNVPAVSIDCTQNTAGLQREGAMFCSGAAPRRPYQNNRFSDVSEGLNIDQLKTLVKSHHFDV